MRTRLPNDAGWSCWKEIEVMASCSQPTYESTKWRGNWIVPQKAAAVLAN